MEQRKNYEQVGRSSSGARNEGTGSTNQRFLHDPSSSINTNMRPPDSNPPVLNYSIQTGEEFALEFMRERVNPRQHIAPNSGDPNRSRYMDLKGILGVSHPGSESGSDISMLNTIEKPRVKEFEKKDSDITEGKGLYESVGLGSVRRSPSRNESSPGIRGHTSSGSSEKSLTKVKFLCSFGGKVLPRPSDGKLRYVGGETRIIRINKDISWQELMHKILAIFDQTRAIKYQLPGEDLDALVSVSCDEDLQNMMEECYSAEDGGSQKLRMFLFSSTDLDDAQFGLGGVAAEGDSEVQYVVAVNGMDLGSRKNSIGLASSSGNNLDELLNLNFERAADRPGVSTSTTPLTVNVPSSAVQSSRSTMPSAGNAYVSNSQPYQGQMMHYGEVEQPISSVPSSVPLHYDYGSQYPSNYLPFAEDKLYGGIHAQDSEVLVKEAKLKQDTSVPKINEYENARPEKEMPTQESKLKRDNSAQNINAPENLRFAEDGVVSSHPYDDFDPHYIQREESASAADTSVNEGKSSRLAEEDDYIYSGVDSTDYGYHEPEVLPQRVFHSERIPREQAELNRLSKSDDSFGGQFLKPQSRPDLSNLTAEAKEKLRDANTQTIEEGLAQFEKYKEFADNINNINSNLCDEGSETRFQNSNKNHLEDKYYDASVDNKYTSGLNHPTEKDSEENSVKADNTPKHVDISIDINDRFPQVLFDMFSKVRFSEDPSGVVPLQNDGTGLSLNMENPEPKHWSFFQRLAKEEFGRKDFSLIDQDHPGFASSLANIEEGGPIDYSFPPLNIDGAGLSHVDSRVSYNEDIDQQPPRITGPSTINYSQIQIKGNENAPFDGIVNPSTLESDYEVVKLVIENTGAPRVNLSLGDIDLSTLQIIKNEDLEELRELGSGTFGTVYHGKWRGTDVAIKRIKKSCFTGRSSEQERLTFEFWREADILSKLHHPNVVAFYGVVQDGPGGTLATVTEYMVNGSLRHVLLCKERQLDRRRRLIIAMDAAFGMEYLHSKNIVHFDLKCDNLLVNLKDPSRPICKVGDFGLSKIKRNTLVTGGVRGTLPWMAPELLNGSSSKVSEKVDVFSFGIVLWEILTGEEPYANMHYGAIIGGIVNNTLRPLVPSHCDSEWKLLMEQCWAPDPVARPSFTEIARRLRAMSAACQTRPPVYQAPNQVSK